MKQRDKIIASEGVLCEICSLQAETYFNDRTPKPYCRKCLQAIREKLMDYFNQEIKNPVLKQG